MADTPLVPEERISVQEVVDDELKSPKDGRKGKSALFSFPYPTPYQIQIDFMKRLFTAIEDKKLGIFESPTGTGKSLSLLCGALSWLELRETRRLDELRRAIGEFDEKSEEEASRNAENWIQAQLIYRKRKDLIYKAKRELKFREECIEKRSKIQQVRVALDAKAFAVNSKRKEQGQDTADDVGVGIEDLWLSDEFAPEFVNSDDEDEEVDENEPEFHPLRIIFASRTHSQLSQFSNELKKTKFANHVSTVTLGSRQNMCINQDVAKLKNLSLINERCLDLQKKSNGVKTSEGKKQKCSGCQYFNHGAIDKLKNQILSEVLDIEDLIATAKRTKACPYYATRKAAKEAQLLLLPYNTILHNGTRTGVGLSINSSSVLLLDEAHNIIDSISNMYSTQISFTQLQDCHNGLKLYTKKYLSRFNPQNLLKYKQLTFIVKNLVNYLEKSGQDQCVVMGVRDFKGRVGIEELDFYELIKFTTKSRIIFKLKGFLQSQEKAAAEAEATEKPRHSNQSIICFIEFLKSIVFVGSQGKIIQDGKLLKFLLLNTAEHFSPLVKSARSIILAGGTMKPYEDIEDQLFHTAKDRIAHFSCDHVIPDENLKCIALSKGPSSVTFDFTFKNRNSKHLLEELGRTLMNVSRIVPGGLVIFFPSYDYENMFYLHLVESGVAASIEAKKKIFREPKDSNCDKILSDYGRQIRNNPNGAILFAVVGGKLSEGINFGDDLGRCVVVVGLPYPNITSVDIKEKLSFISETFGPEKAKQLLPNACFKAVNQSIGRSIRHSADYATIILLDHRFLSKDSQNQLPNWILSKYTACTSFGQCIATLGKFFAGKKGNAK